MHSCPTQRNATYARNSIGRRACRRPRISTVHTCMPCLGTSRCSFLFEAKNAVRKRHFLGEYPVSIPGLFRYAEVRQRDRKHVLSWAGGMWECCWNLSGTKNKSNHNLSCALLRELVFKRAGVPTRPLCRHRSYCFVGKGFHDSLKTSRPESIQTRLGYRVKAVWRGSHVGVTKL